VAQHDATAACVRAGPAIQNPAALSGAVGLGLWALCPTVPHSAAQCPTVPNSAQQCPTLCGAAPGGGRAVVEGEVERQALGAVLLEHTLLRHLSEMSRSDYQNPAVGCKAGVSETLGWL
jgi:hypothetical protein